MITHSTFRPLHPCPSLPPKTHLHRPLKEHTARIQLNKNISLLSGLALAWENTLDSQTWYPWDAGSSPPISNSLTRHERLEVCRSMSRTTLQQDSDLSSLGLQDVLAGAHFDRYLLDGMESLISMGYNLECRDFYDETTLWLDTITDASSLGVCFDAVKLVANRGADIHVSDRWGRGALVWFFLSFCAWEEHEICTVLESLNGDVLWTVSTEIDRDIAEGDQCGEKDLQESGQDTGYTTEERIADGLRGDRRDLDVEVQRAGHEFEYTVEYYEVTERAPERQAQRGEKPPHTVSQI